MGASKETVVVKRMFKVVSPVEKDDGGTYWLRCGSAFVNKDNSINVYLDAIPVRNKQGEGVKLQLRELTEDELRERAERRSTYAARGTLNQPFTPPASPLPSAAADVPF